MMGPRHTARGLLPAGFRSADLPLPLRLAGQRPAAVLRWLGPDDTGRLVAFFASHSETTIYQRYGYLVKMTPEKAARLVNVDQSRDAALGVFESELDERLIAIGRYCLADDGRWAELAFVVHEERRCLGLGTLLLNALIAIGRERGLERLVAQVQFDNPTMLHLFRTAGAQIETIAGTSTMAVTIPLQPQTSRVRRSTRAPLTRWKRAAARALTSASLALPNFPTP